jgi:acetyltransferase-like isoleucine patch superfamily enzyme
MGIRLAVYRPFQMLTNSLYKCILGNIAFNADVSPLADIKFPKKVFIGPKVFVERHAFLDPGAGRIIIGQSTRIYRYAMLQAQDGTITIGRNSTIHAFCMLRGVGDITIGNGVRIAPGVKMFSSDHRFDKLDTPIYEQGIVAKPIIIEDDVWIGSNAVITAGVTIGHGAVVGAGAVVTKSVDANTIVAGVPAQVIRKRT